MIILEKAIVTLLLLAVVTGVLILTFIENDKIRKILGKILVSEIITLVISLFVLIWIY